MMETNELINYLSKKYSIDESKLKKIIRIEREMIGLEAANHIDFKNPDGSWETLPKDEGFDKYRSPFVKDRRSFDEYHNHDRFHAKHWEIYGPNLIKVSLKDKELEFLSLDELEEKFPEIILFIFPIYGAFEYIGENLDIQKALKKFALDFGKFVGNEVVVFDYWSQDEFDYEQYKRQKEVMKIFNISSDDCPCILVSNESPYSWNKSDNDKKAVLIILKNLKSSEIGSKLRKLADNLEDLRFPSSWGNKWDRFVNWCDSNDIIGKGLGAAGLLI